MTIPLPQAHPRPRIPVIALALLSAVAWLGPARATAIPAPAPAMTVENDAAPHAGLGDPWGQAAKLVEADGFLHSNLGRSVALSGDTAIVGRPGLGESGALVFLRDGELWNEETKLTAGDGGGGFFGKSVAIAGDTVAVGSWTSDVDGTDNQGAVYLYVRDGTEWSEQAKIVAADGAESDRFGTWVALSADGDTCLVGAASFADGNPGSAYVFTRDGGEWSEQAKLVASDGMSESYFGWGVALSDDGDTALVGAYQDDVEGTIEQGSAYVFTRDGETWGEQAKLTASDGSDDDHFGSAVALAGDGGTALIGADRASVGENTVQGAAYVFTRDGETWSEQAKLTASEGVFGDGFGRSVDLSGDLAVVGAWTATVDNNSNQGAAYAFRWDGASWIEEAKLVAIDGQDSDHLGVSVAYSDGVILAGADFTDIDGNMDQGAAYVFVESVAPDFATLRGTVRSQGHCGDGGLPLEEATVEVTGAEDDYVQETDENGFYQFLLPESESPIDITVTAGGHLTATVEEIEITGGAVLERNFSPILDAPCTTVGPDELTLQLPTGGSEVLPLTVGNADGGSALDWEVADEALAPSGLRRPRGPVSPPETVPAPEEVEGLSRANGSGEPDVRVSHSLTAGDGQTTLSHSESLTVQAENTVACLIQGTGNTTRNQFLRTFALPEFDVLSFQVTEVSFGVETLDTTVPLTVNLYTLDGVFTYDNLTLIGTATQELGPQDLSMVTVPVAGTAAPGSTLVVELAAPDLSAVGRFFPGSNDLGETAPSYLAADDCGIPEPTPFADLDAPGVHLVLTVTGHAEPLDCTLPGWVNVDPLAGTVAAGDGQVVDVTFDTTTLEPGTHDGALCIGSNDVQRPFTTVPLFLTVSSAPGVELAFDPPSLDFGELDVGSTSPPLPVTLENTGALDATGLAFPPPGSGFEADTGACGDALPAGTSCELDVTFTPLGPGPATATLEATSDQGTSSSLALSGTGVGDGIVTPVALEADPVAVLSDGNGVLEPGELIDVAPAWRNDGLIDLSLTGTATSFDGPGGPSYVLGSSSADYGLLEPGAIGTCLDTKVCYQVGVGDPAIRPATHWEAEIQETLSEGTVKTWSLHVGDSFDDVTRTSPFYRSIETLLHSGVSEGCSETAYCPGGVNSRAQMPVFMLKAVEGPDYTPPACVEDAERFTDVPFRSPFCPWIEELSRRGVVSGCGDDSYCPTSPVTRAQMATFLLKTLEGGGYTPPECTDDFADVPCPSTFADWIEELAAREITGGCSATEYCPADAVSRAQMAVFVTRAFGLALYGP